MASPLLDNLKADDEIHFTDGTKYTCFADGRDIYLLPESKSGDGDSDHMWDSDRLYVASIYGILTDALAGGAKIVWPHSLESRRPNCPNGNDTSEESMSVNCDCTAKP